MKIRLTEGQYKRLLTEDLKGRFNSITPQVLKLMELIYNHIGKNGSKDEVTKFLIKDMGLTTNESLTIYNSWITDFIDTPTNGWGELLGKELEFIYNSWITDFIDTPTNGWGELLGKELEFKGIYSIKLDFPAYLCGRTYIPGYVTVEASSEEEALDNAQGGTYIDMEIDEDSQEYLNPDIDYEISDVDIMEDMVVDRMSDYNIDELEDYIELK